MSSEPAEEQPPRTVPDTVMEYRRHMPAQEAGAPWDEPKRRYDDACCRLNKAICAQREAEKEFVAARAEFVERHYEYKTSILSPAGTTLAADKQQTNK